MGTIRIPLYIIKAIAESPDDQEHWEFVTRVGNILDAKKVSGPHSTVGAGDGTKNYGPPFVSIDFIYNPND